jgi:hypothetical protein
MKLKKVFKRAAKSFSYASQCKPFNDDQKVGGFVRYKGKYYHLVIAPMSDEPCVCVVEDQDDKR